MTETIAVLGAGKVGTTIARAALAAGYRVTIAGSGAPEKFALTAEILMPGAEAMRAADAVRSAEIVILAVPLHKYRSIDADTLAGKILVDAMNHWEPANGPMPELDEDPRSTSEIIAGHFPGTRVVKSLNHIGYHELEEDAHRGRALAYATDDRAAGDRIARFISDLGFDPLPLGSLAAGKVLEPGQPAFGSYLTRESAAELGRELSATGRS